MKNHHNYFQKTNWDKVSQEVGEEVDVLKKRWSQLKRKFYYEKSKTTSDWPFFDRMKFLDDDAGASINNFFLNDGQHNSYNNHQQNILSTNTPFGIVRGIKVMPSGMPKADVSLPPVVQYLGIPYGSAPVGNV
uniref:MADF domain-containing protein n=1 Tax=Meloidogyne hapla TaxID=6305 RepID=A0A1I8BGX5_MELHA